MVKVNYRLLPVKAHFFFFMASMGPILPFTIVFGKQLGISEIVMGTISAVLPLLFLVAKPAFGYLADYFQRQRKLLFMTLICIMCGSHILLYFVPAVKVRPFSIQNATCHDIISCKNEVMRDPVGQERDGSIQVLGLEGSRREFQQRFLDRHQNATAAQRTETDHLDVR